MLYAREEFFGEVIKGALEIFKENTRFWQVFSCSEANENACIFRDASSDFRKWQTWTVFSGTQVHVEVPTSGNDKDCSLGVLTGKPRKGSYPGVVFNFKKSNYGSVSSLPVTRAEAGGLHCTLQSADLTNRSGVYRFHRAHSRL